jgi:hypothetical protein
MEPIEAIETMEHLAHLSEYDSVKLKMKNEKFKIGNWDQAEGDAGCRMQDAGSTGGTRPSQRIASTFAKASVDEPEGRLLAATQDRLPSFFWGQSHRPGVFVHRDDVPQRAPWQCRDAPTSRRAGQNLGLPVITGYLHLKKVFAGTKTLQSGKTAHAQSRSILWPLRERGSTAGKCQGSTESHPTILWVAPPGKACLAGRKITLHLVLTSPVKPAQAGNFSTCGCFFALSSFGFWLTLAP